MADLESELVAFFTKAAAARKLLCLRTPYTQLVLSTWEIIQRNCWELRDSVPSRSGRFPAAVDGVIETCRSCLKQSLRFVADCTSALMGNVPTPDDSPEPLRIGLGSPSTTGCLDASGSSVKMNVLCGSPTSIQAAFAATGLHAIGLPGSRLPLSLKLPKDAGFTLFSAGQPNYNSVAAAVRNEFLSSFKRVADVGGDRRLWLSVTPHEGDSFLWLIFYLPPSNESLWYEELAGIDADLLHLQQQSALPFVILTGDANMQPSSLGKGPDPKPARDKALSAFMHKWSFDLCNTGQSDDPPVPVALPRRKKTIWAASSDTHHCNGGPGTSRTLDLVMASSECPVIVTVHNGVHCKNTCAWDDCCEFTGSDHFLVEALIDGPCMRAAVPAQIALPSHWHEPALWEHGLGCAKGALASLSGTVHLLVLADLSQLAKKATLPAWLTWCIDVLVLLLSIIESSVRDVWVLFARVDKRKRPRAAALPAAQQEPFSEDELERLLRQGQQNGIWPQSAISTCLRWLRPARPQPPERLNHDGRLRTRAASHEAWISQLFTQGKWPTSYNAEFHSEVCRRAQEYSRQARAHIGEGPWDAEIDFSEWYRAAANIQSSRTVTPFLSHRVLLACGTNEWCHAAWKLQQVCGPSCLAWRPALWRHRFLIVKHKKGPVCHESSFRFLGVAELHGLLQEEILMSRISPVIHSSFDFVQTGYRFDVLHHHLTLSVLQDDYKCWRRAFFVIFADFVHAFPRAWRDLLLVEARHTAGIRDGAFALLASVMKCDFWRIALSGESVATVADGVPEGSKYGPPCFNFLPNTLVRRMREARCGLATSAWVPKAWASHTWSGSGSPDLRKAQSIADDIASGRQLPRVADLARNSDLEATCARALDLLDNDRIPVLLHADDPLILASSRGEALRTLGVIAAWAWDVKVSLHLGPSKTVVQQWRPGLQQSETVIHPLLFPQHAPLLPAPLEGVQVHKWLGLKWAVCGEWMSHVTPLLAQCSATVDMLCTLLTSQRIPLAFAVLIFDQKVESGDETLAGLTFTRGLTSKAANWPVRSLALLREHHILDWPEWVLSGKAGGSYKSFVKGELLAAAKRTWDESVSSHTSPIPYSQLTSGPCSHLQEALSNYAPWETLLGQRALIMIRCGYVALGHVNQRQAAARIQACVLCGRRYSNVTAHVVCSCERLAELREVCLRLGADFSSLEILAIPPSHPAYSEVVRLAIEILRSAQNFWKTVS
ncbi:unnamed protein product [Symbiodinium natans]|uniref:Endonuclease/exonuclease/phosphatase domain-containing protein n=1 Tax=Symbiodinium natans TaxID=878477 RepID=A0A812LHC3_9DINO|nr:unnamed protein product [Symbiodinium natans]